MYPLFFSGDSAVSSAANITNSSINLAGAYFGAFDPEKEDDGVSHLAEALDKRDQEIIQQMLAMEQDIQRRDTADPPDVETIKQGLMRSAERYGHVMSVDIGAGTASVDGSGNSPANSDEPQQLLQHIPLRHRQPSGASQLPDAPQQTVPGQVEMLIATLLKKEEGKIRRKREEESRRKEAQEEEAAAAEGKRKRVRPSTACTVFLYQQPPPPENASKEEKRKYQQRMNARNNRVKKWEEDKKRERQLEKAEVENATKDVLLSKCLRIIFRHGHVGELEGACEAESLSGPVAGGSGIRVLQVSKSVDVSLEDESDDSAAAVGSKRKMTADASGGDGIGEGEVAVTGRKSSARLRAKRSRPT